MFKFCDLIEEVSEFNTDLKYGLEDIIGVTIEKGLIPTVANLTQTALDKFYIVRPNTFIYNPRTHGVRLGMGFNETDNVYITSWNNVAFKVKDSAKQIVLSKYLWLYFLRPDWDRLSNFLAWGSSTIVFAWKDFLDIEISLPSIEKQCEIVAEYNTLATRIETNKKLIATLEQTAQTLYRHTFIDNIDPNNLPDGWRMGTVGDFCECNTDNASSKDLKGVIKYLDSGSVTENNFESLQVLDSTCDEIPSRAKRKVKPNDIVYSTVRPNLRHYGLIKFDVENVVVSTAFAVIRSVNKNISNELVYMWLSDLKVVEALHGVAEMSKATYPSITPDDIMNVKIPIPEQFDFSELNNALEAIFNASYQYLLENQTLIKMQTLLLSKMGA